MAMMICVALSGGGAVVSVVSVLCGAGGGLTVQDDVSSISADIAAVMRTGLGGTLFRVSAPSEAAAAQHRRRARPTRPPPEPRRPGGQWHDDDHS